MENMQDIFIGDEGRGSPLVLQLYLGLVKVINYSHVTLLSVWQKVF